ncbi:hypothetical protein AAMO2058_001052600 [Amorphochlora amoebiformis]|mmetsp:Transcript_8180/g.12731  ORF Transcript_8180/g.12731 Transcript_8180/m.12731 type:complete len:331 (-) Transcript_8180:23-1015(-)
MAASGRKRKKSRQVWKTPIALLALALAIALITRTHVIGKGGRPESKGVRIFYDEVQARKYSTSSRMINVQTQMTKRALELLELNLNRTTLILDVGCGSGLSGQVLSNHSARWIGIDISSAMVEEATKRAVEGEIVLGDIGTGLPFREGVFDAAIGISCLQWLCSDETYEQPEEVLRLFFKSLRDCLTPNGRAVFQFYPRLKSDSQMVEKSARKAGFKGGILVDNANSPRNAKHYLCLSLGTKQSFIKEAQRERWEKKAEDRKSTSQIKTKAPASFNSDSKKRRSKRRLNRFPQANQALSPTLPSQSQKRSKYSGRKRHQKKRRGRETGVV